MSGNIHEQLHREEKVSKLLATLHANNWGPKVVAHMGPEHWGIVAHLAGVKEPSDTTIALVKQRLAESAKTAGAGR